MTSTKRFRLHPLAVATLPVAMLLQGCATDPNTGAQSIAGVKVTDSVRSIVRNQVSASGAHA